jgi:F0F1-type ATP synthase membrane subunit c/vacuolar-type H+-ATPase subunit K
VERDRTRMMDLGTGHRPSCSRVIREAFRWIGRTNRKGELMDSVSLMVAIVSITTGLTISVGAVAPALGEAKAIAAALASLAQQPDASAVITRTCLSGSQ